MQRPIALLLAAAAAAAQAQDIDTTTAWNGSSTVGGFGGTATYGQTITAPPGNNRLVDFSFYIDARGMSLPFRAAVYAWDTAQQHAVGNALWQSEPVTITGDVTGDSGAMLEYAFTPPGGVPLVAGQTYVLLGTTVYDGAGGPVEWGWMTGDPYGGGSFVYQASATPASLTDTPWAGWSVSDLAFKTSFAAAAPPPPPIPQAAPTPVPGLHGAGLPLLALALGSAAWRMRWRRNRPRG